MPLVIPVGSVPPVNTSGQASARGAVPENGCAVQLTTPGEATGVVTVAVVAGGGQLDCTNSPYWPAAALLLVAVPAREWHGYCDTVSATVTRLHYWFEE